MYHHHGTHRRGSTPRTPKTPTIEQILQDDGSSWSSGPSSPSLIRDYDPEEDHGYYQKKSVLTRVKERAQRWRRSLSKKKSCDYNDHDNITPSWGVSLDEDEDEKVEEDPEYLGAPMYESEMAPEDLKENARQHPRAIPVIPPKHVLTSTISPRVKEDQGNSISPDKTITQTMTEKLAPAYATVFDATHAIASKIQNLTIGDPNSATAPHSQPSPPPSQKEAPKTTVLDSGELVTSASDTSDFIETEHEKVSPREQLWDKGVSMKEYFANKFEPGDDERELSRVISETMSPRRKPGDASVMVKVKEAISSLLHNDESSSSTMMHSTKSSLADIPISANAHNEEESHGRILQAN